MRRSRRKRIDRPVDVKGNLALASVYFCLGYYSGMRYSVNYVKSLNPKPIAESESARSMIEKLPNEVAAIRLGADPEAAYLKIEQLVSESKLTQQRQKEKAENAERPL
jgi:hypothetical protein